MSTPQADPSVSNATRQPNPAVIFETLNRFQQTMALKGAIDLELFTKIASGATTAAAIAAECNASERGIRVLCDFLTVLGFLTKDNGRYGLTLDSTTFLNKQSPAYLGAMANFLVNDDALAAFRDLAAVAKKGGTLDGVGTMKPENEVWVEFARSMAPLANMVSRLVAPRVSQPGQKAKVLDIAAGHGMYGIAVAQHNPSAEIVAVDWKNVLQVALENARSAGVSNRYQTIPGSAFDVDLGTGYNLVLLPNFLHHFDPPTNVTLLKKLRSAMAPGGRVATIEFVPNDDRVSPPIAASFSMVMLARTQSGDAYTFRELDRIFRDAGFGESQLQNLEPSPQQLVLTNF